MIQGLVEILVEPMVIHSFGVSMRGHSSFWPFITSTVMLISRYAVSTAVRLISPLPCAGMRIAGPQQRALDETGT